MAAPKNRRWIVFVPILCAVALGLVLIGLRTRTGDLALRIRIVRALNEGAGQTIDMNNMAAFTWDELVVLGPYTSSAQQSDVAQLPFYVRWLLRLSSREDICVLAFKLGHDYRMHVVMPRDKGDFLPSVRPSAYVNDTAFFKGAKKGERTLVYPAKPNEAP